MATVLYGCEAWTLTVLEKQLDGCYTRCLVSGGKNTHPTQISISGSPSLVQKSAQEESSLHGTAFATISFQPVSLSWEPKQGPAQRGRGHLTLIYILKRNTGIVPADKIPRYAWGTGRCGDNLVVTSLTEDTTRNRRRKNETWRFV